MNNLVFQVVPKVASVAGGVSLVIGIPHVGFPLLAGSAALNLLGALKQRKLVDVGFFAAWTLVRADY